MCAVAEARQVRLVLIGHTAAGMAFGPAVAARLGSGFASDVFGLSADGGEPIATRGGYGGKVSMDLAFPDKPVIVLTLRGATFKAPEATSDASIAPFAVELDAVPGAGRHIDYLPAPPADVDIGKAEFILSVGRALGEDNNLPQFAALADRLGATLGCSRPVADSGWLPKAHQVGQSGTIAANCSLYLALGISGAVQHLAGMKHVDTIIAVNTDPEAPIFNVAHHGACVDIFELAEALGARVQLTRGSAFTARAPRARGPECGSATGRDPRSSPADAAPRSWGRTQRARAGPAGYRRSEARPG